MIIATMSTRKERPYSPTYLVLVQRIVEQTNQKIAVRRNVLRIRGREASFIFLKGVEDRSVKKLGGGIKLRVAIRVEARFDLSLF
jgi:hypothetical protein